jgi:hypothetical protein
MPRIYTEIRIPHKSPEDKRKYEEELDKAIHKLGYKDRADWYRDCKRQVIRQAESSK